MVTCVISVAGFLVYLYTRTTLWRRVKTNQYCGLTTSKDEVYRQRYSPFSVKTVIFVRRSRLGGQAVLSPFPTRPSPEYGNSENWEHVKGRIYPPACAPLPFLRPVLSGKESNCSKITHGKTKPRLGMILTVALLLLQDTGITTNKLVSGDTLSVLLEHFIGCEQDKEFRLEYISCKSTRHIDILLNILLNISVA